MTIENEYRLSVYQDLGPLDGNEKIKLVRNRINGLIGVRKEVPEGRAEIYRYLREHPSSHIPNIYEVVEDAGNLIIIEEYITGNTVEEFLRERRMEEQETAEFALEICDALKVLHHAEPVIVCRDLKAENVMIDHAGHVKIIDFDIARTVRTGQNRDTVLMGTAEYAAPEQYGYFQTDHRSDIYSLGILLNYVMTGKFPVEKIVEGNFRPVIRKCICMEPSERYQSVEELEKTIRRITMGQSVEAEEDHGPGYTIPGFRSGKIWKKILAVCGYALISWVALTLELETEGAKLTGAELWIERIILLITGVAFVFFAADYRGWSKKIPVVRSGNPWIRTAGLAGLFVILIAAAAFLCVVAEMVIK